MAFDKTPTTWIPSWSEDGTNVTFPIASVPELTAAEADASTGDVRKILFALCSKIWAVWNALATADRPVNMTVRRFTSVNDTTGAITRTFTFEFVTGVTGEEVSNEPA